MLGWEARQGPGAPLSCAYRLLEPRQAVVTARLAFTAVRPYPTRRGARLLMVRVVELEELSRPARNLNPGSEKVRSWMRIPFGLKPPTTAKATSSRRSRTARIAMEPAVYPAYPASRKGMR
jgi:hypothetical protein